MSKKLILEVDNFRGKTMHSFVGESLPYNFTLYEGEVGALLEGKDGSQLLRLIMGRGEVIDGSISFGLNKTSKITNKSQVNEFDITWRKEIGFCFREKGLISNMTIKQNVDLPARYHRAYEKNGTLVEGELAIRALQSLLIPEKYWELRPDFVSWEIRKKTLLARSIVLNPTLLLMDDPATLVHWEGLSFLTRWIKEQKERAVLISCDHLPVAFSVADWIVDTKTHRRDDHYKLNIDPFLLKASEHLIRGERNG